MKTKHTLVLITLGFCLDFIGAVTKIMHHPNADKILITAAILKVTGTLLLVYKLTTYPRIKDFMNW